MPECKALTGSAVKGLIAVVGNQHDLIVGLVFVCKAAAAGTAASHKVISRG